MKMNNIIPTIKYLMLTIKHKFFVFVANYKYGIGVSLWRLIKHDLSKFLPSELPNYGRQFYGDSNDPFGFMVCWIRHQNRNDHHWEYWIPRTTHNKCEDLCEENEPFPMPECAIREMIADWLSAGRAYTGKWPDLDDWEWFKINKHKIKLHKKTWVILNSIINDITNSAK